MTHGHTSILFYHFYTHRNFLSHFSCCVETKGWSVRCISSPEKGKLPMLSLDKCKIEHTCFQISSEASYQSLQTYYQKRRQLAKNQTPSSYITTKQLTVINAEDWIIREMCPIRTFLIKTHRVAFIRARKVVIRLRQLNFVPS